MRVFGIRMRGLVGRREAAEMAVFAFLFQALLPFWQGVPAMLSGQPDYLIICKAFGPPQIVPPDAGTDDQGGGDGSSCPVCLSLALGGNLLAPSPAIPIVPLVSGDAWTPPPAAPLPGRLDVVRPPVRAPPEMSA